MSEALEPLRARVERFELEVRLLDAMIRIRLAERTLARMRVRNEQSIGIHRDREDALDGDERDVGTAAAPPAT